MISKIQPEPMLIDNEQVQLQAEIWLYIRVLEEKKISVGRNEKTLKVCHMDTVK